MFDIINKGLGKEDGKRVIAPMLKNVYHLFVCIKINFFLTIFLSLHNLFPWWI